MKKITLCQFISFNKVISFVSESGQFFYKRFDDVDSQLNNTTKLLAYVKQQRLL